MKRTYTATKEVDSDLFKLEVANFKKNIAHEFEPEMLIDCEHVHFFHTVDIHGNNNTRCNAVANHFHIIETKPTKDGVPEIVSCSQPFKIKKITNKRTGQTTEQLIPFHQLDNHTHKITYIKSSRIKTSNGISEKTQAVINGLQKPNTQEL